MKLLLTFLNILLCATYVLTQPTDYFQQEVNTTINVTLDDKKHTLEGDISITYTNNSPDDLPIIYLHLWANAYKNRTTAFAKQQIRTGSIKFYFAEDEDFGNFYDLDFTVNNQPVRLEYDSENQDIAILRLPQPLKSGETITIASPFGLDIPASFSRLGHVGESYQLTQWFPKPAVYDKDGWHPMPYLNMGEFYSEFGKYDVSITLPENYIVGATGTLQTESEIAFLDKQIAATNEYLKTVSDEKPEGLVRDTFPASSPDMKTIRFTAENVHDFAFFADKRFRVQKSAVTLASGKKIDTWVMFTKAEERFWKNAINYVDRSVEFYSRLVGEYPYPHATAVQSALSAGGGMEYPMITVIGLMGNPQSLDEVITHEVGHNWFYGILAFNERDNVWMDEGINSYYDHRYTDVYYGKEVQMLPNFIMGETEMSAKEAVYLLQARRKRNQAPATPSDDYVPLNYFLGGYEIPARLFKHLEKYLGTANFDAIMQSFYQNWEFKHPQPQDLRSHFEKESGKDLSWLFDGFINSNKRVDYALKSLNTGENFEIKVENRGEASSPFPLSGVKEGKVLSTQWYEGFEGSTTVAFPKGDYDQIVLDANRDTWENRRQDNRLEVASGSPKAPFQIKMLTKLEDDKKKSLYWLPILGWNNYNKTMLGLAIHNLSVPVRDFEFTLAPMYSFVTKDITGLAEFNYNIYPKSGPFQKVGLSLGGRTFSYLYDWDYKTYDKYYKLAPKISLEFRKKDLTHPLTHTLDYRMVNIWQEYTVGVDFENRIFRRENSSYYVNELQYQMKRSHAVAPMKFSLTAHQGKGFTKVFAHLNQKSIYNKKKKAVYLHAFAGTFLNYNTSDTTIVTSPAFLISGITGSFRFQRDYMFDEILLGRTDDRGVFSNQIYNRDADLKTFSNIGSSTEWMLGFGVSADLPIPLPITPYADFALYPNVFGEGTQFTYSGGLSIKIFQDVAVIYLPLVFSKNITEGYVYQIRETDNPLQNLLNRITFRLDLKTLNPHKLLDKIELD